MNIVEKMKRDWDRRARYNARFWIASEEFENDAIFARSGERDARMLLEGLESYMHPSWSVLEVGCGIGRLLKPMTSMFEYVCGVDVSKEMVQRGKEWLKGIENVAIFENNGVDLSEFQNNSFDFIFSFVAFQHMPVEVFDGYLSEINRVLKPGRLLKFQICIGESYRPPFDDTITLRLYKEDELLKILYENRFKVVDKCLINKSVENICESWYFLVQKEREIPLRRNFPWFTTECSNKAGITEDGILLGLAKVYMNKDEKDSAIESLEEIVKLNPAHLEAWLEIINLLLKQNRINDAILNLKNMLSSNPTYYMGYMSLIQLLKKKGLEGEAQEMYDLLKEYKEEISEVLDKLDTLCILKKT